MTSKSSVTSLGSCFADRIRMFLKERGFKYVITEANDAGASANWGRIYNPVSMQQILEYCERAEWRPRERWWTDGTGQIVDPYRSVACYPDLQIAEEDFERHRRRAREVFVAADVVILTYGLVEVWESIEDGAVFHSRPIVFDPKRHRFRILDYCESLAAVRSACEAIRRINSAAAIIVTVSPIPMRATYRSDVPPVTANAYGKAVLVAAVQKVSSLLDGVYYFPSYEIATECVDERLYLKGQIAARAFEMVMQVFEKRFVRK